MSAFLCIEDSFDIEANMSGIKIHRIVEILKYVTSIIKIVVIKFPVVRSFTLSRVSLLLPCY